MLSISRRHFVLGTLSAGAVARTRVAGAEELPAGTREYSNLAPLDRFIHDIAAFADGSFALNLVGKDKTFSCIVTRYDASGDLLWQTELDENEKIHTIRAVVPAVGDAQPGLYISSGFRKLWRLDDGGTAQWERDLFDDVGMNCPQAMAAHPSGGVLVGGVARRPTETDLDCDNCAVVKLAEDGSLLWTWWRDHSWHAFATTIAVTGRGTTIVHMMSYNQTTGSAGDRCEGPFHPQWTVWIDPDGRTIQATPWPADRGAEAMALDRAGRVVFYGRTRPELRRFFRICDAEEGAVLFEHIFGEPEPDLARRGWYQPWPRPLDVSDRGVSILLSTGCLESEIPWGTIIYTLTPKGSLESLRLGDYCGGVPSAVMLPDGTGFLVPLMDRVLRIPLP